MFEKCKWKLLSRVGLFATPWTIYTVLAWNGVGSLSLLQGIFPTHGSNPGLLHYRCILYQLSHKESPRILEWVAHPFSRGSSRPRNQTGVSCIAGGFFTTWAIREAQNYIYMILNPKSKLLTYGWEYFIWNHGAWRRCAYLAINSAFYIFLY